VDTTDSVLYFVSFTDLKLPIEDSLVFEARMDTLKKPLMMPDTTATFFVENTHMRVIWGIIDTGHVDIALQNQFPQPGLTDDVTVTLLNLLKQTGASWAPIVVTATGVPSNGGESRIPVDLSNCKLVLDDVSPPQRQTFRTQLSSVNSHPIQAVVQSTRLPFRSYEGVLDSFVVHTPSAETAVEHLPQGWDSVHATSAEARVHTKAWKTVNSDIAVDIESRVNGHSVATVHRDINGINLGRDTTVIQQIPDNMIAVYPDVVEAQSEMIMYGHVITNSADTIVLTVETRAKLEFTLGQITAPGDVRKVDTGDLKDIKGGTAKVRIWNYLAIPDGGRAYLIAGMDSMHVLEPSNASDDTVMVMDVTIHSSVVNGRPDSVRYDEFEIQLNQKTLDLLSDSPFYTRTHISIPGSNGQTLIATYSDYVKVQVVAELEYNIHAGGDE
jgi:hypothetical protein